MTAIIFISVVSLIHILIIWFTDSDCYWAKKRLEQRIKDIERHQIRERVEHITFTHKGKEFSVYVKPLSEDKRCQKTSIWINKECPLIMYTLIGNFFTCRSVIYAEKRSEFEIREIIKVASKIANQKFNTRLYDEIKSICKTHSYFDDKEENK